MSGSDFDFRPPTEKREPKKFQPPPWEQDAFAQLKGEEPRNDSQEEQPEAPRKQEAPVQRVREKPLLDEGSVTEMLQGLAAEDPPPARTLYGVSMAVALLLAGIGVVLLVWAMAALVGAKNTGTFGVMAGMALALFGAGFVAGGFWLAYKTLKRRGVL